MFEEREAEQCYDLLVGTLEQLGLPAEQQLQKLKGTDVADELALDFCNIGMPEAQKLYEIDWVTQEQLQTLSVLFDKLNDMGKTAALWTGDALRSSAEWETCREQARAVLRQIT